LRNAILATASQVNGQTGYGGGRSAAALTASGAVLTFAAGSSTYGNVEIELRTTMARYDDISIVQSKVSNPGADSSAAVTITLSAADMVAGRTVQLSFTQGVTSSNQVGKDFTVSYTIQTGDTVTNVASALVAAIQNTASGMYAGRGSGFSGTSAEVSNAAGVITIAAAALYGTAYGELSFIKPALGTADTYYGAIRLDSVNNQPITIELGDSANVNEHGLLEMNVGAADYEVNAPSMGSSSGQAVSGLGVSSQSAATKAISVIDNALETVNKSRSYLGAMQNRLTNTINNLDNIVTNTEASKSRILDTDYAKETTELARSQIIAQAATAMLAQANQAPQSVLALLK
jgi:flagellin